MFVRVLGAGAGGGLPQWNCGCDLCTSARRGDGRVRPRSQSSICVSADGARWVLFKASPDVRTQVVGFDALSPAGLRGSGIAAIALTNADIDHCAGLLVLREGGVPPIHCSERTRIALTEGLRILPVLSAYGPVDVRVVRSGQTVEVLDRAGEAVGVTIRPFAVASKPPPYMPVPPERDDHGGDTLGYGISAGGPEVLYVPGVRELDTTLRERLASAACILIDGTFATDAELIELGASTKSARTMGHAPLLGEGGLVEFLDGIAGPRKVLVHINNSNPVLWEGGGLRDELARHGIETGYDGMDITV